MKDQFVIFKSKMWSRYTLRVLAVNGYLLFLFMIFLLSGGYRAPIHMIFIILLPIICNFIINGLTKCRFYIVSFRIVGSFLHINYYSFFRAYNLEIPVENVSIEKCRRNTIKERYLIKLFLKDKTIKQFDNFGWDERDFDKIRSIIGFAKD